MYTVVYGLVWIGLDLFIHNIAVNDSVHDVITTGQYLGRCLTVMRDYTMCVP